MKQRLLDAAIALAMLLWAAEIVYTAAREFPDHPQEPTAWARGER